MREAGGQGLNVALEAVRKASVAAVRKASVAVKSEDLVSCNGRKERCVSFECGS